MTQDISNPHRRSLIVAAGAVAAAPALFNIARAQGAPIKIGFQVPLTGPFSAKARDQVRSAELAVKDWNAAGGHKGKMCEMLLRDTKLNSGEAATRTLELIEKDKVNFVVGSLSAATQLSINAVTRERKVLYNSISQSGTINESKDWSLYTLHEALNLRLGLIAGPERHKEKERTAEIAQTFPRLSERMEQEGTSLSGGEQQMLAIARALMCRPRMILLDEASEGIMPLLVDEMFELFTRLKQSGTTILLLEQNVERALKISDRAYILAQGTIVHEGSAAALLADPQIQDRYCAV